MSWPMMLASATRDDGTSLPRSRQPAVAAFAAACLLFAAHVVRYYPFIADDALISLRFAARFVGGEGLTWTDGPRVEGYSNFLWTVLCAGCGFAGMDLVIAARVLGMVGMAAAMWAMWARYARFGIVPLLAGTLMLAVSGTMAVWTIGGLEQPLLLGLLAWGVVTFGDGVRRDAPSARSALWSGVLLSGVALSRPDGIMFACVAAMVAWFTLRGLPARTRIVAALLAPAVICYVAQLCFRVWYYGAWVPNTALVKLVFSAHYAAIGAKQLAYALAAYSPVVVHIGLMIRTEARGTWASVEQRLGPTVMFAIAAVVVWVGYTTLVGGDIFPAHRGFAPVVLLLAFIEADLCSRPRDSAAAMRRRRELVTVLACLAIAQWFDPQNVRAINERWEWDGRNVGLMLAKRFEGMHPLLAVETAGAVPYWSKLPALDLFGLCDDYLPRHRPATFGSGAPAHELMDTAYFFRRKPDLVLLGLPEGRTTLHGSAWQGALLTNRRFFDEYSLVMYLSRTGADTLTRIWVRNDNPAVVRRAFDQTADAELLPVLIPAAR